MVTRASSVRYIMMTDPIAIQDTYPEDAAHCYGCGRLNTEGIQIRTYLVGVETLTVFEPWPSHTAFEVAVYGGLIARSSIVTRRGRRRSLRWSLLVPKSGLSRHLDL